MRSENDAWVKGSNKKNKENAMLLNLQTYWQACALMFMAPVHRRCMSSFIEFRFRLSLSTAAVAIWLKSGFKYS